MDVLKLQTVVPGIDVFLHSPFLQKSGNIKYSGRESCPQLHRNSSDRRYIYTRTFCLFSSMRSLVLCCGMTLLLVANAAGLSLRSSLKNDACFMTHLDNCNDCITDGSHKCGFCWDGQRPKCASIVGDADMPYFHCKQWVKPNLLGRPTVCNRKPHATVNRLAPEEKKVSKIESKPIQKSDTVPVVTPPKKVEEPPVHKKLERNIETSEQNQTVKTKKPSAKQGETPVAPKAATKKKAEKVMSDPVMRQYLREVSNDVKVDVGGMHQDKIEYDRMIAGRQAKQYKGEPDWRVPIGERERRHIEAYKPEQIRVHYEHKEQVQARKDEIMKQSKLDKREKWEIQNRQIGISETGAAGSAINAGKILATERPDHTQFNAYLKEEDKHYAHLSGYKEHGVRMEHEHSRHPSRETEEDNVEQLAATPDELTRLTANYNMNQGLESSAAYKHSLQDRRQVKHGYWRR